MPGGGSRAPLWPRLLLCAALALAGCAATDPALREALAEAKSRPGTARVKLRPFAEQGNEAAITQICIAYGRSLDSAVEGAERAQAFGWCQHAAAAGHADAQYHLGQFYHWGIGTAPDRGQALRWYTAAASQGHTGAEDAKRGLQGQPPVCRNPITGCRLF